ncbi:MAG TPA: hypothetical protein VF590_17090 [Isosphaeraceae bacterium]|jgi:hypothetical protein
MEHFSLLQPAQVIPVAPGTRMILVRAREVDGAWTTSHEVLRVLGIQPMVVQHYSREKAAPIHPNPTLLEKHGWQYAHLELRYAPIYITPAGKIAGVNPDDPRWYLIDPAVPEAEVGRLAERLMAQEVERQELEKRVETEEVDFVDED